jgi:uroporphyrinogen-III decarboxylase
MAKWDKAMTSKERLLTAMRGGVPDTVPVQIGTYEMIPAKRTGLPWWDIFLYGKVELWRYRVDIIKELDWDGYLFFSLKSEPGPDDQRRVEQAVVSRSKEYHVQRTVMHTPGGDLWEERTYPVDNSSTVTRGLVKNKRDFELFLQYCFPEQTRYLADGLAEMTAALDEHGLVGGTIGIPGLHQLTDVCDGRLETATYFYYDYPELMAEYREKRERQALRELAVLLDARPDYIQIGASGLLTLSTPAAFRELSLPTIQKMTRLCRQAGIPCELHCCGKARLLVEICANETELDAINPLQPPPMGDVDLAEVKRVFGKRLCLKGNVGVTDPMLFGTPADVEKDVLRCLDAAKAGGGYILFSEEQLGRDTPLDNMRAMIRAGREYGKY